MCIRDRLRTETIIPSVVIVRNGAVEKDVTPCHAKAIIFLIGYFDSPANRSPRAYSTRLDGKPSWGIRPRRNTFDSGKSRNASTDLRDIRRKSAWLKTCLLYTSVANLFETIYESIYVYVMKNNDDDIFFFVLPKSHLRFVSISFACLPSLSFH